MRTQLQLLILFLFVTTISFSQIPANYYDSAAGLSGYALKTELRNIITAGYNQQSYDALYNAYVNTHTDNLTDTGYENDNSVLDFYSENPTGADPYNFQHNVNNGGNQNSEGDCYNREHLVPQSSFGSAFPMQSDIHHVIPSDCRVNNFRGSLVFAEVAVANWTSLNGSQRGSSAIAGYTGTVFEPIDEFKGDIARALLYFATRYQNTVNGYTSFEMFNGTQDQVFPDWAVTMLLNWHNNVDPVDASEIARNNAAYNYQGNANPFVDHPEYANLIWNPTPDNDAPTVPTNLIVSNETENSIDLSWTASTDNVGVSGYDIYVDGVFNKTVSTNSGTVNGLTSSTTYSFTVLAKDAAGNSSAQSTAVNGTTTAGGGGSSCGGGAVVIETFENIPNNGSSYGAVSWNGIDGGMWNATDSRTDQTITGKAIAVRNGTLTSPSIAGGIGTLTVKTKRVFGGGSGTFTLRVNGTAVGAIAYSDVVQTITVSDINIEGNVIVSFTDKATTGDRVAIDDLSWTCYSAAPTSIVVAPKVMLQGAMLAASGTLMRDDLRSASLIPSTSPYADAATVVSTVFNQGGTSGTGLAEDDIVDWIWVELRDATTNTTILASQSGLLQRDGDIVSNDGTSDLTFEVAAGDYYIAIKHRNHLGIMTLNTVSLSATVTIVDFTDANNQITFGTDAQTSLDMPLNTVGMWASNAAGTSSVSFIGSGSATAVIKAKVLGDAGNLFGSLSYVGNGYDSADVDMNGSYSFIGAGSDSSFVKSNVLGHPGNLFGSLSFSFSEQLP